MPLFTKKKRAAKKWKSDWIASKHKEEDCWVHTGGCQPAQWGTAAASQLAQLNFGELMQFWPWTNLLPQQTHSQKWLLLCVVCKEGKQGRKSSHLSWHRWLEASLSLPGIGHKEGQSPQLPQQNHGNSWCSGQPLGEVAVGGINSEMALWAHQKRICRSVLHNAHPSVWLQLYSTLGWPCRFSPSMRMWKVCFGRALSSLVSLQRNPFLYASGSLCDINQSVWSKNKWDKQGKITYIYQERHLLNILNIN